MENLKPISNSTLLEFRKNKDSIIRKATERCMQFPEEIAHHGDDAERLIASGFDFTLKALETAMEFRTVDILEDQLQWAKTRLPHDGVQSGNILKRMERLRDVIEEILKKAQAREVVSYVQWLIARQREILETE